MASAMGSEIAASFISKKLPLLCWRQTTTSLPSAHTALDATCWPCRFRSIRGSFRPRRHIAQQTVSCPTTSNDLIALVFPGRPGQVDSFPQILLDVVLGQNFTTKFLFQGFAEIPMMRNMEEFN